MEMFLCVLCLLKAMGLRVQLDNDITQFNLSEGVIGGTIKTSSKHRNREREREREQCTSGQDRRRGNLTIEQYLTSDSVQVIDVAGVLKHVSLLSLDPHHVPFCHSSDA